MATYTVRYRNQCSPQEQLVSGGRWYLDSAVGRKLSGDASVTLTGESTLTTGETISTTPGSARASSKTFIYIKNTGASTDPNLLVTLNNSTYNILLGPGEVFASQIVTGASVNVKASSGTAYYEYFTVV